ncbi:MAG: YbgA family protein [Oligoflexales bacterium]
MNDIMIGVSSCLLGEKVRFDAQHKRHWYINEILGKYFKYVPVCPELEVGMGVPRKSVRLVGDIHQPSMIEPRSGEDWTSAMNTYSKKRVQKLHGLSGYLFKKGSPSCGAFRVKVYQEKTGIPLPDGMGLFSKEFQKQWPLIPIEEEGRLNDYKIRENFIERVFGYHRLQELCGQRFKRGDWVDFHQNNKYLLLARGRGLYTELGHLVAKIADYKSKDFIEEYSELYMTALSIKTTTRKNTDALLHILGFFKKFLSKEEKQSVLEVIEYYHQGVHPLIVPMTLLQHYAKLHNVAYIKNQYYLNPHPTDLSLRNHV